jgi:excisionase family DNA binding protein
MTEPLTLSVEETAKALGIGRNQAYEAVHKGEIPAIRVGSRWLVPIRALKRLLDAGTAHDDQAAAE